MQELIVTIVLMWALFYASKIIFKQFFFSDKENCGCASCPAETSKSKSKSISDIFLK